MREIEFRAWHKNANYMCYNATTDLLDRDYLVFMQYTNLKDKNGKKIFEGDIVRYKHYDGFETIKVKFSNGAYNISTLKMRKCEVLGNIYENEELIHNI